MERVIWTMILNPPPLGAFPKMVDRKTLNAMAARCTEHNPLNALIMRRSSDYYDAGCPMELCDFAACRDITQAL